MTATTPFKFAKSKTGVLESLLGLLLALSAYLILNTINPKLVQNDVQVSALSIGVAQTSVDSQTFYKLTGEKLQTKSQYIPLVEAEAKKQGIDNCIVKATAQVESEWNGGALGCDEDNPSAAVPSRKAFLLSGVTNGGTPFTPTTDTSSKQRNNACSFDPSKTGFGLDWRFSKGGGLMQVTLFPSGYKTPAWYAGVKQGGTYWNNRNTPYSGWQTLLKPEINIQKGTTLLKEGVHACSGDVSGVFRYYQTGSCTNTSTIVNATVAKKLSVYNSCKNGS